MGEFTFELLDFLLQVDLVNEDSCHFFLDLLSGVLFREIATS